MKTKIGIFILIIINLLIIPFPALAEQDNTNCDNRYLTLVNPVRSRNLWFDKTLKPIGDQYDAVKTNGFPATWLLQYDVLTDPELLRFIKNFDNQQELGVFLEVSQHFGDRAKVVYPYDQPWFSPGAVFLSAYSQSERRLLVDELFEGFKKEFGYYPQAVGAWWIDSYSLEYMRKKYQVLSVMIVADQKTTDHYGVWGQWWGVAYYPSKANILNPANSLQNKQDVVIIQWAQRDPVGTTGEGPKSSNYSLQANDYIRQGKDIGYFEELVNVYLDCKNTLGQITVGLETGQESVGYIDEYRNQLALLKSKPEIKALTMSEFANSFKKVYPELVQGGKISREDSDWVFNTQIRENSKYEDFISYQPEISFKDYFLTDKTGFLDRKLPVKNTNTPAYYNLFLLFLPIIIFYLFTFWKKKSYIFFTSLLFLISCFGLILKSNQLYGWEIYYGPKLSNLFLVQFSLIIIVFSLFLALDKLKKFKYFNKWFIWTVSLGFGIDFIIQQVRYTLVSNIHYLGFAANNLGVFGVSWTNKKISFFAKEFPSYQATALLRIDLNKYWDNLIFTFVVYPLIHIVVGIILAFILIKISKFTRISLLGILLIFLIFHLMQISNIDPQSISP